MDREPTIHDVLDAVSVFSANVDRRFDGVDQRLDRLENRMGTLETKVGNLDTKVGALERTVVTKEYMEGRLAAFSR
jgi:hypothetical protein